jgi:hypothetical protein
MMDDLERYVNVLFADYAAVPAAQRLRIDMLNQLLLKKEALQISGLGEQEAIQEVLSGLDDFGAPAEGNLLIYINLFYHQTLHDMLLWLLAAFVMSVPLLVLGRPLFSILFLAAVAAAAFFYLRHNQADWQAVAFVDSGDLLRRIRRVWMLALAAMAVWLLVAAAVSFGSESIAIPVAGSGPYRTALLLARFYPGFLLLFVPLVFATQGKALFACEVGNEDIEDYRRYIHG